MQDDQRSCFLMWTVLAIMERDRRSCVSEWGVGLSKNGYFRMGKMNFPSWIEECKLDSVRCSIGVGRMLVMLQLVLVAVVGDAS